MPLTSATPHSPWYTAQEYELPGQLFAVIDQIEQDNSARHAANLHHLRMYSNRMAMALSGQAYMQSADFGERIRLNVTKSAIDAAVAQIATNRTRPMFLTEKGDYFLRLRAERLGRFIVGQFYGLRYYQTRLDVFRDACVFGTGWLHVYHDRGRVCIERVLDDEVVVDENESRLGKPRQLFRIKNDASRTKLAAIYPEKKTEIFEAARSDDFWGTNAAEAPADCVTVREAWLLPTDPDAEDGRHVIALSNCVLVDEVWRRETFPLVPFRWTTCPVGFRGIGAAEELAPIQVEINYIAQKIQKLMTLATSMVWKEKGSVTGKISNADWGEREYTGKPPIFQTTSAVSAEYFAHLDRLYTRAYEIVGISQMSATSTKPAGLQSGEALRVYNDIGTRRFLHTGLNLEQFDLDVAEAILETARDMELNGEDLSTLTAGDKEVEQLNFSDVSIDRNKYHMRARPVSILPDEPPGKIEALQKLASIDPSTAPRMLRAASGIPDLEAELARWNAPQDLADRYVSNILLHGQDGYEPPAPFINLALTRLTVQQEIMRAMVENVPEDRLELLRRFLGELDVLEAAAMAPQMMGSEMGAAADAAPGGPPGMPNVPGQPSPETAPAGPLAGVMPSGPQGAI